jgi:hypothetical protein
VKATYDLLDSILENNNLLPAWSEFQSVKTLLTKNDEMKTLEKAGKLKIKMKENEHEVDFSIKVPENYPNERPTIVLNSCTFSE